MSKKYLKNQNGSITLFVLLAILFFLIVIFSVFISSSNKKQTQLLEIDKIKSEYDKDVENIDVIYDDVISNLEVDVTFDPNGGTYNIAKSGTVDISTNVVLMYESEATIKSREYAWNNSNTDEPRDWTSFNGDTVTVTQEDVASGSYYLWVRVTNNMNNASTVVSKVFQVDEYEIGLTKSPDEYTQDPVTVNIDYKNTYITNKQIGIGKTVEEATNNATSNTATSIEVQENCYVYVTATDAYGNTSSSIIQIDNIDTEPPIITLTPNGGKYDVKDNETIKIDVKVDVEDKMSGVKEVQYCWSTSNTEKPSDNEYTTIDNHTTVSSEQLGQGEYYLWIKATDNVGNVVEEPSYVYVLQAPVVPEVVLKINNSAGATYTSGTWTNQNVYHEISLPTSEGTVSKYQYSIDGNTWKDYTDTNTSLNIYNYALNGNTITYTLQEEIDEEFYVKAIYDDGRESGIAQFRIQIDKTAPVIGNISSEFTSLEKINITVSDIVENASGMKGYYISTNATNPTINSTWINTEDNTFTIQNLNAGTKYYIWLIDNANNISERTEIAEINANYLVDNTTYTETLEKAVAVSENNSLIQLLNDYTDSSTVTINKNVTIDTGNYILTRTRTINFVGGTEDNATILEINGKIVGDSNIYILTTSNHAVIQGNGTLESQGYAIYNSGNLTQNGQLTVSGYYVGIYNSNTGTYVLNSGNVRSTSTGNPSYGICNGNIIINGGEVNGKLGIYRPTILTINNGTIKGTEHAIDQGSGTVTINNGDIMGTTSGVYASLAGVTNVKGGYISGIYGISVQNASATINVTGGTIVGSTYGINASKTSNGKITIGDINEEVNHVSPVVSGGQYGIYTTNNNSYNFYNGIIMGTNAKPYTDTANPREGYTIYIYYNYAARKYCAILVELVDEIKFEQTPTEWTNGDVEVQILYPNIESTISQYSENGEDWQNVENDYVKIITVSENKTIYARILDESGIILKSGEHEVTNIDKIEPTVSINPETTKYIVNDQQPTANIEVNVTVADEGGSGLNIKQYGWSQDRETEPTTWIDFGDTDTVNIERNNTPEGTYFLWLNITDHAGNVSNTSIIRYIVEYKDFVAKIGNDYYYTIQEAVDSAGTNSVLVEILKDTDETTIIEEGQNITLELDGHIVGSSTEEIPTFINNGTLKIIDNNAEKTGTIENLIGTAIENTGTLTIGESTNSIEDNTPTIFGNTIGIKNEGTLNYYDGTIIGKVAIDGGVQETPQYYGPVGVYEDGMTIVNLRVISDYVARIDWFYYSTLQSAFDDCEAKENNTEQTTVHMLKDIVLEDTVYSYAGQNIRLNLDGYALTNSNNTILINEGTLEIVDFSVEQTGNIQSSIVGTSNNYYRMIQNNGNLSISSGTIISETNYTYPIYNSDNAVFTLSGGDITVSSNLNHVYGVYNAGTGTVEIMDGTINCSTSNSYSAYVYGLYNAGNGTINMSGGEIYNYSANAHTFGIDNVNNGIINMSNGKIYCSNGNYNNAYGIRNRGSGIINISGGETIVTSEKSGTTGIENTSSGTINITNGIIEAEGVFGTGINHSGSGTINMQGGTVTAISNNAYRNSTGVQNTGTGTVNISGGNINSISHSDSTAYGAFGILNASSATGIINISSDANISATSTGYVHVIRNNGTGVINVEGGNITGTVTSGWGYCYGIFNDTEGGIINIGKKGDGETSTTKPHIIVKHQNNSEGRAKASNYGVYKIKGDINFYDGIIESINILIHGGFTEIEDGYQVTKDVNNEYNRMYLIPQENKEYVVQNTVTGKQYYTMQEAIDDVNETAYELKILKDFDLSTSGFVIPENVTVKIDFNGKQITNEYFMIKNYGNLEIEDKVGEGGIESFNTWVYNLNTGSIKMTGGTIACSTGQNYTEYSSTEFNNFSAYGIYNSSTRYIDISGGQIVVFSDIDDGYGIYNESTEIVNITGGAIYVNCNGRYTMYGIYNASIGTVNVGGLISTTTKYCEGYGIYNFSSGIINLTGGNVETSTVNDLTIAVRNRGTGEINISGTTISAQEISGTGDAYGVQNYSTGTINIVDATITATSISSNTYGVHNNSTGIINLGTKGDGIVDNTMPSITATSEEITTEKFVYGLYNINGIFNFYDGRIEGTTRAVPIDVTINEIEENTELLYEENDTILTLSTEKAEVAQIGTKKYTSLQEAIEDAGTEETTIELLRGIQYLNQDSAVSIESNQNIILDLRNYPIVSTIDAPILTNQGTLKIIDTVGGTDGKITSNYEHTIYNMQNATLEVNGGIIANINDDTAIRNEGTLNITGGTVTNDSYNNDERRLTSSPYLITNSSTSTLHISSGNFEAFNVIQNLGNMEMTGGNILANSRAISNEGNGNITISGGNISSQYGVYTTYGIYNTSTGTINITTGNILSNVLYDKYEPRNNAYGIYSTAGTINIEKTSIEATNDCLDNAYGIYLLGGTVNLTEGTVTGITNSRLTTAKAYGIYATSGTINIGRKDGNILTTSPNITGETNGIYTSNDSKVNMYDGIVKGETTAITGNITEIEDNSEFIVGTENTYETVSLTNVTALASINGINYDSLKEAIDSASEGDTITILRSGIVAENIIISSDKNIVIDLNGNTLTTYMSISNNGTLQIKDSSAGNNGTLSGYKDIVINNYGICEFISGNISNNTYGIYNNARGTTNISGGTLSNNQYGVYNVANGIVNVNSGNITGNTYGTYNYGGTTNVTGGNISSNTYGIYNSTGTTNISNLTITGNTYEVFNGGTGTTNILSGNIINSSIAVVNAGAGTINIGTQDANINKENPEIQGEEYGIANTGAGAINFYDGIIKGKQGAIQGYYLYTETGYVVQTYITDGYYCDILTARGSITSVAKIGTVEYTNLQSAINACPNNMETTIVLTNSIDSSSTFTIERAQNIILDLNGYTITTKVLNELIINEGNLTIVDNSTRQTGKISNEQGEAIDNTGTLTLGLNDDVVSTTCPEIYGQSVGITSTGILNFYDGLITGSKALEGNVTLRADGYVISSTTDEATGKEQLILTQ